MYSIAKSNINYTVEEAKAIVLQSVPGEIVRVNKRLDLDTFTFEYKFKIKDKNKKKDSDENYITVKTEDGFDIYVGKNNKQNDYLTHKKAKKNDLWFHVKDAPGSHVILKNNNKDFTNNSLLTAAKLAAKYSSLSKSQNIPVDYTFKMYVKRHPAKKPGLVTYTNYKTINISI